MFICQNMGTGLESVVTSGVGKYPLWVSGTAVVQGAFYTDALDSNGYQAKYSISAYGNTVPPSQRPTHFTLVGPSSSVVWQSNAPLSLYEPWQIGVALQAGARVFDETAYRDYYVNSAVTSTDNTKSPSACVNSADPKLQARYTDLGASNAFRMFDGETISTTTVPPNTLIAPNNLLENPELVGSGTAIAGWTFYAGGSYAGGTQVLAGRNAVYVYSGNPTQLDQPAYWVSDNFPIVSGKSYVASTTYTNVNHGVELIVDWLDAGGAVVQRDQTTWNNRFISNTAVPSEFGFASINKVAPSGVTQARIIMQCRGITGITNPSSISGSWFMTPYFGLSEYGYGEAPDNGDLICSFGHIPDATPRVRTVGVFGMFGVERAVLTVKNSAGSVVQTISKDTTYEYGAALHAGTVEFTTTSIANPRFTLRLYRASAIPQLYCGMICVGEKFHVGDTETNASFRYVDYSKKERDDTFGDIQFIRRGSSRAVSANVYVPQERADYAMRGFNFLRGKSIMLDFNNVDSAGIATNYDHLRMWGFVKDYETNYVGFGDVSINLKAEGLVEG